MNQSNNPRIWKTQIFSFRNDRRIFHIDVQQVHKSNRDKSSVINSATIQLVRHVSLLTSIFINSVFAECYIIMHKLVLWIYKVRSCCWPRSSQFQGSIVILPLLNVVLAVDWSRGSFMVDWNFRIFDDGSFCFEFIHACCVCVCVEISGFDGFSWLFFCMSSALIDCGMNYLWWLLNWGKIFFYVWCENMNSFDRFYYKSEYSNYVIG